jgi:hypothetical protein
MKVLAKPIEVVAWFDTKGEVHPTRFRINIEDEEKVIKIGRVKKRGLEKLAGNHMVVFTCESEINGVVKSYEIKYEMSTCKWLLFKL